MCGISAVAGRPAAAETANRMTESQRHRGPDAQRVIASGDGLIALGSNRLKVIDLSDEANQPLLSNDQQVALVFNGEIYNYKELRAELSEYTFRTSTDSEVILASYERWGEECVRHFIGMFAFVIWDKRKDALFAARDRFGVKPLYYCTDAAGGICLSSEIKALHTTGISVELDAATWAGYLASGISDGGEDTFWEGIKAVPAGHFLRWHGRRRVQVKQWYDLAVAAGTEFDEREDEVARKDYHDLLIEATRFRFRSDVPIGVCLSGGLDSSLLVGVIDAVGETAATLRAFTFVTGDSAYDELPWVRELLQNTNHPLEVCPLTIEEVPRLAESVQEHCDEPFGGIPTLAYSKVFEAARSVGIKVLLDGQGMDEQWAGYDYYLTCLGSGSVESTKPGQVQGTKSQSVKSDALIQDFCLSAKTFQRDRFFPDDLRERQYRDASFFKIPRALRFNDRISMRSSIELREPFLDHRLFELALRQPQHRKIVGTKQKVFLRQIAAGLLPKGVVEAPKRPVQTPQREWLRGPLAGWATDWIDFAIQRAGGSWLEPRVVRESWSRYRAGEGDNSFFIWQWISLGLILHLAEERSKRATSTTR